MASLWRFGGLGWREVLRRLWRRFWKHKVLDQAAMLSFYFIMAIFPLLLFLMALLGFFLQSGAAVHQALQQYLTKVVPSSALGLIDSTLQQIAHGSSGSTLSLSLLFSLYLASSGLVAMMEALNVAYQIGEARPWWKQRLVALVLTIGVMMFLAVALVIIGYGDGLAAVVARGLSASGEKVGATWRGLEWVLLMALVLLGFNLLYIFAPNVKHRRWHWLMPGTVLGVALWIAVSYGFKLYLSFFNSYNFTYGSIAAVIILLFWFYLSGIAILLGAELNSEIEQRAGSVEPREKAE